MTTLPSDIIALIFRHLSHFDLRHLTYSPAPTSSPSYQPSSSIPSYSTTLAFLAQTELSIRRSLILQIYRERLLEPWITSIYEPQPHPQASDYLGKVLVPSPSKLGSGLYGYTRRGVISGRDREKQPVSAMGVRIDNVNVGGSEEDSEESDENGEISEGNGEQDVELERWTFEEDNLPQGMDVYRGDEVWFDADTKVDVCVDPRTLICEFVGIRKVGKDGGPVDSGRLVDVPG